MYVDHVCAHALQCCVLVSVSTVSAGSVRRRANGMGRDRWRAPLPSLGFYPKHVSFSRLQLGSSRANLQEAHLTLVSGDLQWTWLLLHPKSVAF